MRLRSSIFFIVIASLSVAGIRAQTVPVGTPVLEDYYRRKQLLGEIDSATSFMVRPLSPRSAFGIDRLFMADSVTPPDTSRSKIDWRMRVALLPVSLHQLIDTKIPTGWNDDAFIRAKGYQLKAGIGLFAQYGPLTVQLRPELVTAANNEYEGFPASSPGFTWARYSEFYQGVIDRPERFGTGTYTKLLSGQSSVMLNYDAFSVGISSENLWWGPGAYNSLLMSNSAPGFYHLALQTRKPVRTSVGSFELQGIAGRLEDSGYDPPQASLVNQGIPVYKSRNTSWRYLSGMIVTWQPKWVPGLFIGYSRTLQAYHQDIKGEAFPFGLPFKRFMPVSTADTSEFDQYYSVQARWMFPSAHGEIYFEYGHNNHPYDYDGSPQSGAHSRAYVAGIRKLVPLANGSDHLQFIAEATELNAPSDYLSKAGESWYVNRRILQGYTNRGKLLGAGVGPGGSVQTFNVSWNRRMNQVGLRLERFEHNNDLYYYFFSELREVRWHWVDISATLNAQVELKHVLLFSNLGIIKLMNYQYAYDPAVAAIPFAKGIDKKNIHAELGVYYRF